MKFEKQLSSCSRHTLKVSLVLPALAFATAFSAVMPDEIYASQPTFCDHEEHVHGPECWADEEVTSSENTEPAIEQDHENETGFDSITDETAVNPEESQEPETNRVLVCTKEVHTHKVLCYADTKADLETEEDWNNALPKEKKDTLGETIAETAKSQLGEKSSEKNYTEDAAGAIQFLSRYGQWIGEPYGDPALPFAAFVLHYSGAEEIELNWKEGFDKFLESNEERIANSLDSYIDFDTGNHIPYVGDVVLFEDVENPGTPGVPIQKHIGFISNLDPFSVIYFQSGNEVAEAELKEDRFKITGYIRPKASIQPETEEDNSESNKPNTGNTPAEGTDSETKPEESGANPETPANPEGEKPSAKEEKLIEIGDFSIPEKQVVETDLYEIELQIKKSDVENSLKNGQLKDLTEKTEESKETEESTLAAQETGSQDMEDSNSADNINEENAESNPAENTEPESDESNKPETKTVLNIQLEEVPEEDPVTESVKELTDKAIENLTGTSESENAESETAENTDEETSEESAEEVVEENSEAANQPVPEESETRTQFFKPVLSIAAQDSTLEITDIPVQVSVRPKQKVIKELSEKFEGAPEVELGMDVVLATSDSEETITSKHYLVKEAARQLEPVELAVNSGTVFEVTQEEPHFPNFNVEYFIEYDKPVAGDNGKLPIIETINGDLPKNGTRQLNSDGSLKKDKNKARVYDDPTKKGISKLVLEKNNSDNNYSIKRETLYIKGYADREFNYLYAPNIHYWNVLRESSGFQLSSIEVHFADGTMKTFDPNNVHFTNWERNETQNVVLITKVSKISLKYDHNKVDQPLGANFHDYDITSGDKITRTAPETKSDKYNEKFGTAYGINSNSNYAGRDTESTPNSSKPKGYLAFGNANTGTGLDRSYFIDSSVSKSKLQLQELNKFNEHSYGGCTFGITKGLDSNGQIIFHENVDSPDLFGLGGQSVTGKKSYEANLTFSRTGDTYILKAVKEKEKTDYEIRASNLDKFYNPAYVSGDYNKVHSTIYTNGFWPLDQLKNTTDQKTGTLYRDGTSNYGAEQYKTIINEEEVTNYYPPSDDSIPHNNMFGMNFSVNFELDPSYVGPLVYTFFGDDDLWVYLDNELIVDIGGVHSSVGQRVDLSTYLRDENNKNKAGKHNLSVFYTERGLSGSTCYMEFTLPNVTEATPKLSNGSLEISKVTEGVSESKVIDGVSVDRTFAFDIEMPDTPDQYSYYIYPIDMNYDIDNPKNGQINVGLLDKTVHDGSTIYLKKDQKAVIYHLPENTEVTVTEKNAEGYSVSYSQNGGDTFTKGNSNGKFTIQKGQVIKFRFKNAWAELPATGASGFVRSMIGGFVLIGASATVIVVSNRKRSMKNRKK